MKTALRALQAEEPTVCRRARAVAHCVSAAPGRPLASRPRRRLGGRPAASAADRDNEVGDAAGGRSHETDVVVIGGGIGGLCAAALSAKYGLQVTVCESHSVAGGAAHAWERDGFTFESGPSLYSGVAARPTTNPLGQVLHALGEELPCVSYNTWLCHLPEGTFLTEVGSDQFAEGVLRRLPAGAEAVAQWARLKEVMRPLARASTAVPAAAVRSDAGALVTLARFLPRLLTAAPPADVARLMRPYSEVLAASGVTHPFLRHWMNLLCFLLSGALAKGTATAEIAFMFDDWFRPAASLEFPRGGSGAIVAALERGLARHGGRLLTRAHVEQVLVEGTGDAKRAAGVRLRDGSVIRARSAVVSNASLWDTVPLLPRGALPPEWAQQAVGTAQCDSFMHLHVGIDAAGLPPDLEIHHIVIDDWERGVDAPQNLVLVSIPSVLDPSMAPPGHHVIHGATARANPIVHAGDRAVRAVGGRRARQRGVRATEGGAVARAVARSGAGGAWSARARQSGHGRHAADAGALSAAQSRHIRRYWVVRARRPSPAANPALKQHTQCIIEPRVARARVGASDMAVPSAATPLRGLLVVGDSNFPGPGVPAVAAGGMAVAHALAPVWRQCAMLDVVCP